MLAQKLRKQLIRLEIENASVKSEWRATIPPPSPTIFPNISNENFEIAILFNVVAMFGNHVFEDECPQPLLRALRTKVVSYALGAYKVYIEKGDPINFGGGGLLDW